MKTVESECLPPFDSITKETNSGNQCQHYLEDWHKWLQYADSEKRISVLYALPDIPY